MRPQVIQTILLVAPKMLSSALNLAAEESTAKSVLVKCRTNASCAQNQLNMEILVIYLKKSKLRRKVLTKSQNGIILICMIIHMYIHI